MTEETDWLRLREGGEAYAVEASHLLGDYGTERLQLNPAAGGALGWLLGIGGDVPVFGFPGAPRRRPETTRIVLLSASRTIGLAVDTIEGTEGRPATARLLPAALTGGLFSAATVEGGEIVLVVEPEAAAAAVAASDHRTTAESTRTAAFPVVASAPTEPAKAALPPGRLLVFAGCSGKVLLGLPASQVIEIVRPAKVRPLPGAPASTLGLIVWRDEPIPVLDVEQAIGASSAAPQASRLLIARAPATGSFAAIPVEGVAAILQGPLRGRVLPLPVEETEIWVRQVYQDDGRRVILPDLDLAFDPAGRLT